MLNGYGLLTANSNATLSGPWEAGGGFRASKKPFAEDSCEAGRGAPAVHADSSSFFLGVY